MAKDWGFHIPKEMQPDFARIIQKKTETAGRELSPEEIIRCFRKEYLSKHGQFQLKSCTMRIGNTRFERNISPYCYSNKNRGYIDQGKRKWPCGRVCPRLKKTSENLDRCDDV